MKKVDIYTSNTCGYCHAAMEYFKENNIEFTEHNVSLDPVARKELMSKGVMSVPLILIDGEQILGFDKSKVDSLLELQ
jgi:glutaredoxin-like YruB-family protein